MRALPFLLLLLAALTLGDFQVDLLITREVRGAVWPLNEWNSPCSIDQANATPCDCYGGASRRQAVFSSATEHVSIDTGSYFSGSGLYFPVFRGNVSAEYFSAAGYKAWTLSYRDFAAGASAAEPTGGALLASYIDRVRALNTAMPAPVITNLNLTADPHLTTALVTRGQLRPQGHVSPYGLVALPDGRTMGVLAFLDPTHLFALSSHYAARTLPYAQAMAHGLAQLARLPGGPPDVTVAIITSAPVDGTFGENLEVVHGAKDTAISAFVRKILRPATGLDILILGLNAGLWTGPTIERNWAGDDVLVLPPHANRASLGTVIENATVTLNDDARLVHGAAAVAGAGVKSLTCAVQEEAAVAQGLAEHQATLDTALQEVMGYLDTRLAASNQATILEPSDSPPAWGTGCTKLLGGGGVKVCGCRVSECPQGALAADAQRFASNAQIALVNGGSLRSDDLPKGAVTRAELISLLPFLSEVIVVDMPGSLLRSALQHGISGLSNEDADSSPPGKFLQVSSTLRFQWYFDDGVPALGTVTVAGSALDDEASYKVAISEYIANGGDGFDQFAGLDRMSRGLTQADTVALYLAQFTAASPLPEPSDGRIMQTPEVVHLPLGVFCKVPSKAVNMGKPSQREECDHALHMVEVINNKNDGLYDDLLPSALLVVNESYQGCVQGLAERALAELRGAPNLLSLGGDLPAAIGPSCSNDVAAVTSAQSRASSGWNGVVVSPSSTAPVLTDGEQYPNVVRMSTNEIMIGAGLANLVQHYQWRRVAVLHDDSLWGRGSAGAFMSSFLAGSERAELINCPNGGRSVSRQLAEADGICAVPEGETRGTQFSLDEVEAGDNDETTHCRECIVSLLQGLHDKGARIIVLATQPRIAGQIFHLVHETGLLYGKGYAWILTWLTEDMLRNPDASLNTTIIYGAEGVLSITETVDTATREYQDYVDLWATRSSLAACRDLADPKFCDADGDPNTLPGYSAMQADSVLVYATAMHSIYRVSPSDPTALHDALINAGSSEAKTRGISGPIFLDPATGDRRGRLTIKNFQISHSAASRRLQLMDGTANSAARVEPVWWRWTRRLFVPLESTVADFVSVGTYNSEGEHGTFTFYSDSTVYFPGRVTAVPADRPAPDDGINLALVVGMPIVACIALLISGYAFYYRFKASKLQGKLQKLQDNLVGTRAVLADFDPRTLPPPIRGATGATSAAMAPAAAPAAAPPRRTKPPLPKTRWYWQEDPARLSKHNFSDVFQPGNFVSYSGSVIRELETAYQEWVRGQKKGTSKIELNLTDRIASTGNEEKAFCPESGKNFEVDFASMEQTNAKSSFVRKVLRRQLEPEPTGTEIAEVPQTGVPLGLPVGSVVFGPEIEVDGINAQPAKGFRRFKIAVKLNAPLSNAAPASLSNGPPWELAKPDDTVLGEDGAAIGKLYLGGVRSLLSNEFLASQVEVKEDGSVVGDSGVVGKVRFQNFLQLRKGQLVQISRQRPDGWAYGNIILDELENQGLDAAAPIHEEASSAGLSVSTDAGWFPLAALDHDGVTSQNISPELLNALQSKMGGAGDDALKPPTSWKKQNDPLMVEKFLLPDGQEKRDVAANFMQTLHHTSVRIVSIERIQNVSMWQSYAVKRQTVVSREKKQDNTKTQSRFERVWLFHGCHPDVVPNIMQQGFNRSFCGRNATVYGKGVYFARDASYSSAPQYATKDSHGHQYIFACRVVVGEYCVGKSDALTPDVRSGHTLYDSTVNNKSNPSIFVTYHDAQAYPEFLIKFTQ